MTAHLVRTCRRESVFLVDFRSTGGTSSDPAGGRVRTGAEVGSGASASDDAIGADAAIEPAATSIVVTIAAFRFI